jgi:erythritol transport system permease protein
VNFQRAAVEQASLSTNAKKGVVGLVFDVLLKFRALLALALLVLIFSLTTSSFLTTNNLAILAKHVSINASLAIGMTFVMLAGGIDLSVGSVAGLAGMVAGWLLTQGLTVTGMSQPYYPPVAVVIPAALALGAGVGAVNGLLITRLSIAPFIATLGTLYVGRGAALLLSGGRTFPNLAGEPSRHNMGFPALGQSFLLGVPLPVWLLVVGVLLAALVAGKTPFGRHVYAVGGNERAALLSGIRVERVKVLTYVISSFCAALVGLIIAAQLEAAHPATGESFELTAIAAVVLGGTSLLGGRGSVVGSLIGALVIGVLADGLVMLGTSEFWQMVIKGVVIILAVAVDQLQASAHLRVARSQ